MSAELAFYLITWAAIIVLFLGLVATLREVRLLRAVVMRDPDGFAAAQPDVVLGGVFADGTSRPIVAAVDSGCPLCRVVVDELAQRAPHAKLLTHESPSVWSGAGLEIISDREAWRAVSHLSPPVLMHVDGGGAVRRMTLPVRVEELDGWIDTDSDLKGAVDVVDARSDS
ncbi:hypothetical protein NLX83_25145 [Allokutzneria sp. A3M-2-11 16]|uniref:hypothetical protein n=1 Tax=Allokutzneria sp. A3M-2-11 16 TaxID=2962043 RepID=UPI0020B7BCFD|nr:hypothetical protein [Allokutzneria sp. A3M-2-11 16]MCP3802562.1 hypothetical protein [Allokutzneria sp. A3M-2-11 16]